MSRTLPGVGLEAFWPLGFNGWNGGMDANLRLCSALTQPRALNLVATEPGSPTDGQIYLLDETNVTHPNNIAIRDNGAWVYVAPQVGWTFYDVTADAERRYDGTHWSEITIGTVAGATLDTDGTMAANSDTHVPSQKAVVTYVTSHLLGMFDLRGTTDCSANPNYPAAVKGDTYVVTVAGKIGGASGTSVNVGDIYFATADNAGGTQAAVGASWDVILHAGSLSGALLAANNLSDLASASTARTNLGLGSIATYAEATAAEIRAGTASRAVSAANLQAAVAPQTLTDGATVSWDMSAAINAKVTLGGNRTLAVSNPVAGATYSLNVIQDGTGTRTLTWPASFDWGTTGAPTLTTTASKRDRVTLFCTDAATPKFDAFLSGKGFS